VPAEVSNEAEVERLIVRIVLTGLQVGMRLPASPQLGHAGGADSACHPGQMALAPVRHASARDEEAI
jgi:hypothetical protein